MKVSSYCNIEHDFFQRKLFSVSHFKIEENDPVMELKKIMEVLDLSNFKKAFPYKTKVDPLSLLAVIIFAYSRKVSSTREIETLCNENIKFKFLLNDKPAPDHSTISRFIKKCKPFIDDIYNQFTKILLDKNNINTNNIYIDGSKIEAYANKYTFVWKKAVIKNMSKMLPKIEALIYEFNKEYFKNFKSLQEIIDYLNTKNIVFVHGKGKSKSNEQKFLEKALSFFERNIKYENHLKNLANRNSYSKTDVDATFMRMKEDYMLNGQLKPGYNLQIGVCSELIVGFKLFPNPTDVKTLIPFLEHLKESNIKLKNIVADAGYESYENYEYIKQNNYVSYIKPQMYDKSNTRKFKKDIDRPENLIYDRNTNSLIRKDGIELEYIKTANRKGIKFLIFKNPVTGKTIGYNYEFRESSKRSYLNITSELGKQLRMNRSIQVEGAFSIIKESLKLRKLKIRGQEGVKTEIAFTLMGYNFKMHMKKIKNNKKGEILHKLKIS